MTNNADPDQLASSEANSSGFILFAKTGHEVFSKRRVAHFSLYSSRGTGIYTIIAPSEDSNQPMYSHSLTSLHSPYEEA